MRLQMEQLDFDKLASKIAERVSMNQRWLKLKQAAQYAQIGEHALVRLAQDKELRGFQDLSMKTRPWIFDKKSIDEYRMRQAELYDGEEDEIALDILKSLD